MQNQGDRLYFLPWEHRNYGEKIILLTGAGVSINSGLPDGSTLTYSLLHRLSERWFPKHLKIDTIAKAVPLETAFQAIADHGMVQVIQRIIARIDSEIPGVAHKIIPRLVNADLVKRIYTFNFDTLHEQSFYAQNIDRLKQRGRAVAKDLFTDKGKQVQLIKLHGSCDYMGTITLSEYIQGFAEETRENIVEDLMEGYWLVIGYGGWDIDFQQIVIDSVERGAIPKDIIWVDKDFPEYGGRTDILADLKKVGTATHLLKCDLNQFCEKMCREIAEVRFGGEHSRLEDIVEPTRDVPDEIGAKVVVQLSLHTGNTSYSEEILKAASLRFPNASEEWDYRAAILYDLAGLPEKAAPLYKNVVHFAKKIDRRVVSAARLFSLTRCDVDLFDNINTDNLSPEIVPFFDFVRKGRRTDKGGLNRQEAIKWCDSLPTVSTIIKSISSTDWVRFYISVLTEIARLYHEFGEPRRALRIDMDALRLAEALADPALLGMTTGNVGACLMAISETVQGNECEMNLKSAQRYLARAVRLCTKLNRFGQGLHMCNLGVVNFNLGEELQGIHTSLEGLEILENIYPNYAICFYGEISRMYAVLAAKHREREREEFAVRSALALKKGWSLADRLSDWDDVHYLRQGLQTLKRLTIIPPKAANLIKNLPQQ